MKTTTTTTEATRVTLAATHVINNDNADANNNKADADTNNSDTNNDNANNANNNDANKEVIVEIRNTAEPKPELDAEPPAVESPLIFLLPQLSVLLPLLPPSIIWKMLMMTPSSL